MAWLTKPVEKPEWATGGGADVLTPSVGKQAVGWIAEKPPYQWFNWLHKWTYLWIAYFENRVDGLNGITDAVIGATSGSSHASFAALLADGNVANIKNIWVISPIVLTADIVLPNTFNGKIINFKPQATITKGGSATKGLVIEGQNVRVYNPTFIGFSGGGDKALEFAVGSKNNMVFGLYASNSGTDPVSMLGTNNNEVSTIIEE